MFSSFYTKFVVGFLLLELVLFSLLFYTPDPLHEMERQARVGLAIAGHASVTTDDRFYNECNTLQQIIEQNLAGKVTYGKTETGALGETEISSREVTIDAALHWTARFETLTHEAGHILTPAAVTNRADREAYAEAVGGLTAYYAGDHDALKRSASYLGSIKGSLHILTDYRADIIRAAKFLSGT